MVDLVEAGERLRSREFRSPPSVDELVRRHGRRSRRRLTSVACLTGIIVALSVIAVAVVSARSRTQTLVATTGHASTSAGIPAGRAAAASMDEARSLARQIMSTVVVPPGSRRVSKPPQAQLGHSFLTIGCQPLAVNTEYWVAPGTNESVTAFLESHPVAGMSVEGSSGPGGPLVLIEGPSTGDRRMTTLAIRSAGGGKVGLRVDTEVVPAGAVCTMSDSKGP